MGSRSKEIDGRILERGNGITVELGILDSLILGKGAKMGKGGGERLSWCRRWRFEVKD